MSACDDCRSNVPLYLDDELRGNELEDFRMHLRECANCKAFFDQEQALTRLLHRSRPLYRAPAALRGRVAHVISSQKQRGAHAPERLRRRIFQILASPIRHASRPAFRWKPLAAVASVVVLALMFVPPIIQRARANAFVETAVATHRGYLDGNLPLEIQTSSPSAVTAWFAGKVPFHFQLPASQQVQDGEQNYRLTGSRLVNFHGNYVALTTYEMQGQKISLLVASSESAIAAGGEEVQSEKLIFHYHSVEGYKVITWSNHGLTYALVSSLPGSARQSCLVCHQNMADRMKFSHHQ